MGYRLVKGAFDLVYDNARRCGSRPDGDSVWFKPSNPKALEHLGGGRPKVNGGGMVTLRLEAVDALESHYGAGHQRLDLALAARDELLHLLRFASVEYSTTDGMTVRSSTPEAAPGFILTRGIDSPRNGRVVAFAFAGRPPRPDGTEFIVPPSLVRLSANFRLALRGLQYPMYYADTLPADIRRSFDGAFAQARAHPAPLSVWKSDTSMRRNRITSRRDLEAITMWPKLFRRLWDFLGDGSPSLAGFGAWLEAEKEDRDDALWVRSMGQLVNLHDVVETKGHTLRMRFPAEDLVVVSKQPGTITTAPSPQLRAA